MTELSPMASDADRVIPVRLVALVERVRLPDLQLQVRGAGRLVAVHAVVARVAGVHVVREAEMSCDGWVARALSCRLTAGGRQQSRDQDRAP